MKKFLSVFLAAVMALSVIAGGSAYIFAEAAELSGSQVPASEDAAVPAPAPETVTVPADRSEGGTDELFAGYVDSVFRSYSQNPEFSEIVPEPTRDTGADILEPGSTTLLVYEAIVPEVKKIAAGEENYTFIILPVSFEDVNIPRYYTAADLGETWLYDDETGFNDNALSKCWNAVYGKINTKLLLQALLNTLPYDLYWFDKTEGFSCGLISGLTLGVDQNGVQAFELISDSSYDGDLYVTFVVSEAYKDYTSDEPSYTVTSSVGQTVQHAAQKAASIVTANKKKRDTDKLTAYRDAICALTDYNYDAAYGDDVPYGDPWQLIWVFDEDDSTNVVCEGYSKAFQYLVDMSTFYGDVSCRLVNGSMGGPHMWNVITMPDGRNYVVDVTNSDAGTTGNDSKFLRGGKGSVSGGYTVNGTSYSYDSKIIDLYGEDRLRLAQADYKEIPFITSCRLELTGKIGIRLYFRAPDDAKTAKIFFEEDDYQTAAVTLDLKKSNNSNYNSSKDLFLMVFPKVTSRQMTMHIKLVIYDKSGKEMSIYYADEDTYYTGGFYYCAADWANRVIRTKPSAKAVTMAKALLNYGGAAQLYLNNYNPENPANPNNYLSSEMASLKPDSSLDMVIPDKAYTIGFDHATLSLSSDTSIRLYFNKAVTVTVDGKTAKVNKNPSSDVWLVSIDNINSRQLDHMYEIVITGEGGTATIRYSALSWANKQIASNNANSMPTAKALYLYNRAAKAYLN